MKASLTLLSLLAAAAMLPSCSGSQNAAMPQSVEAQNRAHRASGSSGDLIYAVDITDKLYIFSYPEFALVATVQQQGFGVCSDTLGNVWVGDSQNNRVLEYAHGGTMPIETLNDPNQLPANCSVDPSSGNLAVVNRAFNGATGSFSVYLNAKGTPTIYTDPNIFDTYFCGYDNNGNLFVDGSTKVGAPVLAVLPKGSSDFITLTLNKQIVVLGPIQWDGSYITIQDRRKHKIYRLSVTGSSAIVVGSTRIEQWRTADPRPGAQIFNGTFVAPTTKRSYKIGLWSYPAGGRPLNVFAVLPKHEARFRALTVSVAPSR